MAKTQTIAAGVPVTGNSAGLGDDWLQSINEYFLDEHVMSGALGTLYHRPGSARPYYDTMANVAAWAAGLGVALDNGRLGKASDGPFYVYDQATATLVRVVGGRYARTAPIAGAAQVLAASTFTTVTGFSIAGFVLNAGLDYRIRANAVIRKTAGLGTLGGLRVRVTEFGAATYDYEQPFNFDGNGVQGVNFDCLHTAVATGASVSIVFQVWYNAIVTINTTAAALAGWTGAPNNSLDVMEV